MIKIEIECATGAEARQQLIDLLYNDAQPSVQIKATDSTEISSNSIAEAVKQVVEIAATTGTKSNKRKTKAEIEAEKTTLSVVPSDDPETTPSTDPEINDTAETLTQDNKEQSTVTVQMLQEKAVEVIRKGKKEEVVKILKKFGGDSVSQSDKNPLKPEVYADVMDAFNKL